MDKKLKKWLPIAAVAIVVLFGVAFWIYWQNLPGALDEFAKCLKEKNVLFYGAFWCPHCQSQKRMFGNSEKYLPYVECSTADSNGQLPVCNQANIKAYPTWQFQDGSRQEGELTLQELSEKSGCSLPE